MVVIGGCIADIVLPNFGAVDFPAAVAQLFDGFVPRVDCSFCHRIASVVYLCAAGVFKWFGGVSAKSSCAMLDCLGTDVRFEEGGATHVVSGWDFC